MITIIREQGFKNKKMLFFIQLMYMFVRQKVDL